MLRLWEIYLTQVYLVGAESPTYVWPQNMRCISKPWRSHPPHPPTSFFHPCGYPFSFITGSWSPVWDPVQPECHRCLINPNEISPSAVPDRSFSGRTLWATFLTWLELDQIHRGLLRCCLCFFLQDSYFIWKAELQGEEGTEKGRGVPSTGSFSKCDNC